jgi:hypothetical protein
MMVDASRGKMLAGPTGVGRPPVAQQSIRGACRDRASTGFERFWLSDWHLVHSETIMGV